MPNYRRYRVPGATYFFTVVTQGRARILTAPGARKILSAAIDECRRRWPFRTDGIVLLPEHLHALWTLPLGDDRYSGRWSFIKKEFTRRWLEAGGDEQIISEARRSRNRRGVWQPWFWEHLIRDDDDHEQHLDYIHYNPVKHGHAASPRDWPYSSFHRWVRLGAYDPDWGRGSADTMARRFVEIEQTVGESAATQEAGHLPAWWRSSALRGMFPRAGGHRPHRGASRCSESTLRASPRTEVGPSFASRHVSPRGVGAIARIEASLYGPPPAWGAIRRI